MVDYPYSRERLPERLFSHKDSISDPTLTPVNWIWETIKPSPAPGLPGVSPWARAGPLPSPRALSIPQLDGVEVGKWCKHWVMAGSGSGSAHPAREEARKQIYSSLPAWPEPELWSSARAKLGLLWSLPPPPSLSLSPSLHDKRIRSRPPILALSLGLCPTSDWSPSLQNF